MLVPDSVKIDVSGTEFNITDGITTVKVFYNGVMQVDTSIPNIEVTVEGVYYPGEGMIIADKVLYKCPSKTEPEIGE